MNKILFIGSLNYPPNIDAIRYFYRNVYPSILKISTTIAMIVVGSNPTSEAEEYLNKNNICHYFNVKDVRNIYEECAVSVVPIRYGGGTRLKILESMALGRPVVSTPLGCEGIDVKHGENILIAKSSAEYASQIIELINDNSKWELIRNNGRKLVEEYYEWNKIALNVNKMYEKIMKKRISQII